jgi:hypothetical protein
MCDSKARSGDSPMNIADVAAATMRRGCTTVIEARGKQCTNPYRRGQTPRLTELALAFSSELLTFLGQGSREEPRMGSTLAVPFPPASARPDRPAMFGARGWSGQLSYPT